MKQRVTSGHSRLRKLHTDLALAGVAAAGLFAGAAPLHAQDSGALVDKLVKKGILSDQEAAEVRADMQKDFASTSAGKINLSNSVSSLKLYGDLRLRWQYNDTQQQIDTGSNVSQQSRLRYRLRLGADIALGPDWFAGIQLQTGQTADSGNQTYSDGFNNDSIFISKAFLGWQNDWMKVVAGKQSNPFYTTDLVWDPDINPAGFVETVAFHKMPLFGGTGGPSGDGKDVKDVVAPSHSNPWEITLVAAQFIFGDNNEFNNTGDLSTDPWIFEEQLIAKYNFTKDTSITIAPGFMTETAAHITGALNTLPFSDEGAVVTGTTALQTTTQKADVVTVTYDAAGVPTKTVTPTTTTTTVQTTVTPNNQTVGSATVSGPRTITSTSTATKTGPAVTTTGEASGLKTDPSKATQTVTSTITGQSQTVSTSNNVGLPAVNGETRNLQILTAPGDISFKLGGLKTKLYWDFAYNFGGQKRFDETYQMQSFGSRPHTTRDDVAWLVGLQFGETKKKGDWQLYVNYRETGLSSVDPNLNDSDFALSALNMRGFKVGLAYAVTDFVVIDAVGYLTWNLDSDLFGGRATSPGGIAPYSSANTVQLEVNIKF